MSKTNTKSDKFYECDLCHGVYCKGCESPKDYMKWKLCPECFNPFHSRHQKRWKRIIEKRDSSTITFIPTSETLKNLFNGLANIYDELLLKIENDKMIIRSIDPSRVTCMETIIPIKQGRNNITKEIPIKTEDICLALQELKGIVRLSVKDTKLCLNDDLLNMEFLGIDPEPFVKEEVIERNITWENPSNFLFNSETFIRITNALRLYSGMLSITQDQKSITFLSEKHKSDASAEILLADLKHYSIEDDETVTFDNTVINRLNKHLEDITEEIIVSLMTDSPLKLEYLIEQDITFTIAVAPRVEEVGP